MELFSQVLVETEKKVFGIFKSVFGTDDVETSCNADGIAWEHGGMRIQASWKLDDWESSLNGGHQVTGDSLESLVASGKARYSDSVAKVMELRQWISDNDTGRALGAPVENALEEIAEVAAFFARASELLLTDTGRGN